MQGLHRLCHDKFMHVATCTDPKQIRGDRSEDKSFIRGPPPSSCSAETPKTDQRFQVYEFRARVCPVHTLFDQHINKFQIQNSLKKSLTAELKRNELRTASHKSSALEVPSRGLDYCRLLRKSDGITLP